MNIKNLLICITIIFFYTFGFCENSTKRKILLVTAKATKSKLVSDINNSGNSKAVLYPMLFNITFEDIHLELGDSSNLQDTIGHLQQT